MPPIQFKKTLLYPLVLHPKCFNSDNQTITRTYEEIRRHEQGCFCFLLRTKENLNHFFRI